MNPIKLLLPVVIPALFIASCRKHVDHIAEPPVDDSVYNALKDCTIDTHYDSLKIARQLQGFWKQEWYEYG